MLYHVWICQHFSHLSKKVFLYNSLNENKGGRESTTHQDVFSLLQLLLELLDVTVSLLHILLQQLHLLVNFSLLLSDLHQLLKLPVPLHQQLQDLKDHTHTQTCYTYTQVVFEWINTFNVVLFKNTPFDPIHSFLSEWDPLKHFYLSLKTTLLN